MLLLLTGELLVFARAEHAGQVYGRVRSSVHNADLVRSTSVHEWSSEGSGIGAELAVICRVTVSEILPDWEPGMRYADSRLEFDATEFVAHCAHGATIRGRLTLPLLPDHVSAACGYANTARWTVHACETGASVSLEVYARHDGRFTLDVNSTWPRDSDVVCEEPLMGLDLNCEWRSVTGDGH
jgi:hypothetical protein